MKACKHKRAIFITTTKRAGLPAGFTMEGHKQPPPKGNPMNSGINMTDTQRQLEGQAAVNQQLIALSQEMISTLKQLSLTQAAQQEQLLKIGQWIDSQQR